MALERGVLFCCGLRTRHAVLTLKVPPSKNIRVITMFNDECILLEQTVLEVIKDVRRTRL